MKIEGIFPPAISFMERVDFDNEAAVAALGAATKTYHQNPRAY